MVEGRVSVIIPTYQGYEVIERCVDSVLGQLYKDVEIIVVDDNGKGTIEQLRTEKVMRRYTLKDSVHYLTHEVNINASAARNTGLNIATGEYICLLDDDDVFLENRISDAIEKMNILSDDYAMVYCSFIRVFSHRERYDVMASKEVHSALPVLLWEARLCSSNIMIRHKVLKEIGGFDESFRRHQDWEVFVRILDKYKCSNVEAIGLEKIIVNRNQPASPDKAVEYGMHFLTKMTPYMSKLSKDEIERVYAHYYVEWAKLYFHKKQFAKYAGFAKKSGKPLMCFYKALRYSAGRLIR